MPKTQETPHDKFGREIEIDDILLYPITFASSANIRIGRVVDVRAGKVWVHGVDDNYEWRGKHLNSKPGVLVYPGRTVRVPRAYVATEYQALLDTVTP